MAGTKFTWNILPKQNAAEKVHVNNAFKWVVYKLNYILNMIGVFSL